MKINIIDDQTLLKEYSATLTAHAWFFNPFQGYTTNDYLTAIKRIETNDAQDPKIKDNPNRMQIYERIYKDL